ncbi:hypothetical protein BCP8-2_176 [Bacillus phage BCP8-2]|uniref:Uncharacterized protein n=1 Tax=Bacillus phage BCP8-2 TaxID=1129192 RepID=A0A0E3D9J0_9CAUD|nr:endonuclease [Bacillus phage BCP8-2]AHJ87214.1 hypothetical protein BCP8-2_176 [Bacillus phage BCP8-2]
MKICTKCTEEKHDDEFAKQKRKDGTYRLSSQCKKCLSDYKKSHYNKNKDKYLDKSKKQRERDPEGTKEYNKKYHQANKEKHNEQMKVYSQTEEGKLARQRAQDKYRKSDQYKLKQNARKKVLRALESGKLVKPLVCESCKEERSLEGHHEDYNKPLEVKWLCKECHENEHHLNEGHEPI